MNPISAEQLIVTMLLVQRREVAAVRQMAKELDIDWREVSKERRALGIRTTHRGFPAKAYWEFPRSTATREESLDAELRLAMWEHHILQRKTLAAYHRIQELQRRRAAKRGPGASAPRP